VAQACVYESGKSPNALKSLNYSVCKAEGSPDLCANFCKTANVCVCVYNWHKVGVETTDRHLYNYVTWIWNNFLKICFLFRFIFTWLTYLSSFHISPFSLQLAFSLAWIVCFICFPSFSVSFLRTNTHLLQEIVASVVCSVA